MYEFAQNQKFNFIILNDLRRQINPHYDIPAYFQIKDVLRELKPQIVHTHSAKAGILGRYAAHSLKGKWGADLPKVVHGVHGLAFHPYQGVMLNKFYIAVEKAAAKRTDFFISVADAMTNQSLAAGIGSADKYATAYSAIEEDGFLQPISDEQKKTIQAKIRHTGKFNRACNYSAAVSSQGPRVYNRIREDACRAISEGNLAFRRRWYFGGKI